MECLLYGKLHRISRLCAFFAAPRCHDTADRHRPVLRWHYGRISYTGGGSAAPRRDRQPGLHAVYLGSMPLVPRRHHDGRSNAMSPHRKTKQIRPGSVVLVSGAFGILAYGIVYAIASAPQLPRTVFPDAIVTRPYDILPLVLLLCAGAFVYPRLYQQTPSVFPHALIVSTLPNVAAQFHMAFGSTTLFDYHFNIAHFFKIIAYLIPFSGLTLDYIRRALGEETRAVEQLTAAQQRLMAYSVELKRPTPTYAGTI